MPKLAIYVPKKDMRQIEKWRKKINFSRVFMKALMSEIRERERVPVSDKGNQVAQAAAFYKQQLMQQGSAVLDDQAYAWGYERVLACGIPSESIRAVLPLLEKEVWSLEDHQRVLEMMGEDQKKVAEEAAKRGFDQASRPAWESSVVRAYVKGVCAAWKRVCEEMGSI